MVVVHLVHVVVDLPLNLILAEETSAAISTDSISSVEQADLDHEEDLRRSNRTTREVRTLVHREVRVFRLVILGVA